MRIKLLILILLLSSLLAAERTVSLQEVLDAALQNNDELAIASYELQSTRWSRYAALSSFLPTASVSYSQFKLDPAPEYVDYMGNSSTLDDVQTTATFQIVQPILTGGKRLLGYLISRRLEEMAEHTLAASELDTRTTAEQKYLILTEAFRLLQIARDDLASMENNLIVAKVKYETGTASEAEYLQLQSEFAAKQAALSDARMYFKISASDLANFCGFGDRELFPAETERDYSFEALLQDIDLQTISPVLEELCLSRNLTLKTLEENISLNKINRTMALSTSLPSLNLIYEKSWDDDFDLDADKDESTTLMLTASLPLLPLADTFCNYKKEQHQVKIAQREYNSASQGIKLQVYSTLLALVSSVDKLNSSELALKYAEQTLLQVEERYRNNLASANDLLNVSLLKQSSEISLLQDQIDLIKYKSDLKKLLNLRSDDELKQIILNI